MKSQPGNITAVSGKALQMKGNGARSLRSVQPATPCTPSATRIGLDVSQVVKSTPYEKEVVKGMMKARLYTYNTLQCL